MKRISFGKNNRSDDVLHIETEGCIVNIRIRLHDKEGREVTVIEVLPDRYTGEEWDNIDGHTLTRIVRRKY